MKSDNLISVIITTYNWPSALSLVLKAYSLQYDKNFELIVADDGSDNKTKLVVDQFKKMSWFKVKHVWDEDKGFRAARIRNQAALQAEGRYLIFSDGDCLPLPSFIQRHRYYQKKSNFVTGNRILLGKEYTDTILNNHSLITGRQLIYFFFKRIKKDINRIWPMLPCCLNSLLPKNKSWQGAKTCNLAVCRDDFFAVNGFDQRFEGWGYEDSDLVIRLIKFGCLRKSVKFGLPVLHLWHPESDRTLAQANFLAMVEAEKGQSYKAVCGLETTSF